MKWEPGTDPSGSADGLFEDAGRVRRLIAPALPPHAGKAGENDDREGDAREREKRREREERAVADRIGDPPGDARADEIDDEFGAGQDREVRSRLARGRGAHEERVERDEFHVADHRLEAGRAHGDLQPRQDAQRAQRKDQETERAQETQKPERGGQPGPADQERGKGRAGQPRADRGRAVERADPGERHAEIHEISALHAAHEPFAGAEGQREEEEEPRFGPGEKGAQAGTRSGRGTARLPLARIGALAHERGGEERQKRQERDRQERGGPAQPLEQNERERAADHHAERHGRRLDGVSGGAGGGVELAHREPVGRDILRGRQERDRKGDRKQEHGLRRRDKGHGGDQRGDKKLRGHDPAAPMP